ncbi:MAG: M16 family metallopeptidase [Candidatus Cryptobacteroides sp.]
MKRIFIILVAVFTAIAASAQGVMQLPVDENVVIGKLDNGMTYYLRSNPLPAQRAEFYLATNVGAFQETEDQDGLAHFLEHMCFNGTKNFPGKDLLNYLQSIGAEFGRNINASTGFEETKYMLNNIPIVRESIIDSCLLVMHDYSHFVTCDPAEIDAERGVILEERRTRRTAQWRMFEQTLPYYFTGTPYARRTLIGGEEQLKTFKPESLVNFYKTWYQPDMQALVVVGDFDVKMMEEKIRKIFSDIPAPQTPTVKPVYPVEMNEEPAVAIITDKEASSSSIEILWKSEAFPLEFANTNVGLTFDFIHRFVEEIMSERFDDITSKPGAPFLGAGFGFGGLCNECDAVMGNISFRDGEAVTAFAAFMTEIEKMRRFGFTEAEVQRAKDNIISYYEKAAEAASTRKNPDFIGPILRNFYDNKPLMDPETSLEIAKSICEQFNAGIIKQMLEQTSPTFMADQFITIIYNGPEKEGLENPDPQAIKAVLAAVKEAEISANEEESTNEPLVNAAALKGAKVAKETQGIYGTTEWTLKNGLKVVVKPTEFKKDQVNFNLYKEGGKTLIADEDLYSFEDNVWQVFLSCAGVSKFPKTTLNKMLAGKIASAYPFISGREHGVKGSCSPKYIETALQLMYLTFTDMRFDQQEFDTAIQQIEAVLPNLEGQPGFRLQKEVQTTIYGNNPRVVPLESASLEKVSLATMEKCYKELFNDAAGATLVITGNVNLDTLKPLVEKYMGSLPKGKKASVCNDNTPRFVKGEVRNHFSTPMETPKASVLQLYTAYMPDTVADEATLDAAKFILDMIYTETLREEEGGTYGAGVYVDFNREPEEMAFIQVYFDTNVESSEKLAALAVSGLSKLANEGPTQTQVDMAKENMKKNMPESRINNNYWANAIKRYLDYGEDYDAAIDAAIESVSIDGIRKLVGDILSQGNFIEIIMRP